MRSTTNPRQVYIDAGVFLGMHSDDERVRVASKNAVVERYHVGVAMTLDQIGLCDAVIWRRPRTLQDAYYPFMDQLHSNMPFHRVDFEPGDLEMAQTHPTLASLPARNRLMLARMLRTGAVLHSWDSRLLEQPALPVCIPPEAPSEIRFPEPIEDAYRHSLQFRLPSLDEVYRYEANA